MDAPDAPPTVSQSDVAAPAASGLRTVDVAERVASGRTNAFSADTSRTWWRIIRAKVFTIFNAIVIA